ncbi:hypothetical protein VF04_04495 [Nostoc linckia z7]|uniref:Uncharacterized protein n=2 Tax=Nostoc linckia TaxID=92942 RepID=A0A9Q6EN06_NOSLI|nr:hypothetical protein [Nostoc linckia]PHK42968.1 hypothetical protein VF12_01195 [Nostoc linckia z15]PHK48125.1 hypothetical protein VF13_02170 [Nostoc linckia z16]PHJ65045.1 hypothetical protein VF02_11980 [Nostoc linckia z1]PHJ70086.1 hypothetical protein VF05_11375 [Nostoc linckia z3]PHJ75124.1 hypothetical protein VF03_12300 [Nostoc linckia z2]
MQRNLIWTPSHPGYVSGRYYQNTPLIYTDSSSTGVLTVNSLTYTPFRIDKNVIFDRFAISCAGTVANGAARFGIYTNKNGVPGNLLVDTGEIIAATSGIKEAIISFSASLLDWYWYAGATPVPPNLYNGITFLGNNYLLGQATPTSTSATASIRQSGFTYGAMPSVAPIDNLSFITGNLAPLFWLRAG